MSLILLKKKSKVINNDLFKKHFDLALVALAKKLLEIEDAEENSRFAEKIKNRWSNLKDKNEEMSKEEIK